MPEECNGYPWAKGNYCHIITHSIKLREPVEIVKPRNPGSIWSIKSEDERARILAQIPDGPPICHDLSVLQPRNPDTPPSREEGGDAPGALGDVGCALLSEGNGAEGVEKDGDGSKQDPSQLELDGESHVQSYTDLS